MPLPNMVLWGWYVLFLFNVWVSELIGRIIDQGVIERVESKRRERERVN